MKTFLLITSIIFFIYPAMLAQTPNWQWAKQSNGNNASDYPFSIATDGSGNTIMFGYFESSAITFGTSTLINSGVQNYFIVKYDPSGNVLWAKSAIGEADFFLQQVAVDPAGNSYVCGAFRSDTIMFDSFILTKSSVISNDREIFLVKYDSSGNVIWAKSAKGNGSDFAVSLTIDEMESIYVAGGFRSDTIKFDTVTLINNNPFIQQYDMFLAKYDSSGNVLWVESAEESMFDNDDIAHSVSTDNSGNIYVLGTYESTIIFGSTTLPALNAGRFLVKYNTSGNVIWAKSFDVGYNGEAWSLKNDFSGNIYFTGIFAEDSITLGPVTLMNSTAMAGHTDLYIVKVDSSGHVVWAKSTGGNESERTTCVSVDGSGNAYLTGYFGSQVLNFSNNSLLNSDQVWFTTDMFFLKYDSAGNEIWGKSVGGITYDNGIAVAIDLSGTVYFAGNFGSDSVQFGSTVLLNSLAGGSNIFLAKLDTVSSTAINENKISQNQINVFPIPFSISTTISFSLSKSQNVSIKIFDVNGRLVSTLADKIFEVGENEIVWYAEKVNAGVYFLQFQTSDILKMNKMIVTK